MRSSWPWVVLALLGAYHGLNPAMGWLFALALGLQEKRRSAVIAALLPIALGHAAAIAVTILALSIVQRVIPFHVLKWPVAAIILALGIFRLFRASHPRGGGMRVGRRDLVIWSFLMASAHGAGLMLIPVLWSHSTVAMHHEMSGPMTSGSMTSGSMGTSGVPLTAGIVLASVLVHTAAMLGVAGVLALASFELYEKVGLKVLRHTWFNFDLLWAVALLIAAVAVLFG
jgi:hypothetical protein